MAKDNDMNIIPLTMVLMLPQFALVITGAKLLIESSQRTKLPARSLVDILVTNFHCWVADI
jgi:hypothetical protein